VDGGHRDNPGAHGLHVAIIMDGNGRWATSRGVPRAQGHRAGAEAIRRIVKAAPPLGIGALSLYAFSGNNWDRPAGEVAELMQLFEGFFRSEREEWISRDVRLNVFGRRDRLSSSLLEAIEAAETATAHGGRLQLRFAVDYSAQDAILEAALRFGGARLSTREEFSRILAQVSHAGAEADEVDLLIRSGGEQRLSDFLLWEIAYAELFFSQRYWPDFGPEDLREAIEEFRQRERRFGRLRRSAVEFELTDVR
jgi:undecaprenyl diphosphate synthase